jgi:hypothetical protein
MTDVLGQHDHLGIDGSRRLTSTASRTTTDNDDVKLGIITGYL